MFCCKIQVKHVMCENAALKRRLEAALADSQRKSEEDKQRLATRVRTQFRDLYLFGEGVDEHPESLDEL